MPIWWHPRRWWSFCMSEEEKKGIESISRVSRVPESRVSRVSGSRVILLIRIISIEVLRHFATGNYTRRFDKNQNFSCLIF